MLNLVIFKAFSAALLLIFRSKDSGFGDAVSVPVVAELQSSGTGTDEAAASHQEAATDQGAAVWEARVLPRGCSLEGQNQTSSSDKDTTSLPVRRSEAVTLTGMVPLDTVVSSAQQR